MINPLAKTSPEDLLAGPYYFPVLREEVLKNSSLDLSNEVPAGRIISDEPKNHEYWNTGREGLGSMLPANERMAELLGLDDPSIVEDVLRSALLDPLAELTSTRGKRIRGQLVTLGYRLVSDTPASFLAAKQCGSCADVVELIHAGSLVIDDVQDGSSVRRGRPALHVQFGVPIAVNAGNWLYFWPFELLRQTELPVDKIFYVYEHCHRTLLRAHFGQAVDLGARVDSLPQRRVAAVCLASMKLKTGALMGFATILGGAIAGASEGVLSILDEFGRELGVSLQMFDDLGNLIGKCEPVKRYEDLRLSRPSWVWACAADSSTSRAYRQFCTAVSSLPDAHELDLWSEAHNLAERVRACAHRYLDAAFRQLKERLDNANVRWSKRAFEDLRELGNEITVAYG
jgi:geranylgeranyl pyrophosphate synthase